MLTEGMEQKRPLTRRFSKKRKTFYLVALSVMVFLIGSGAFSFLYLSPAHADSSDPFDASQLNQLNKDVQSSETVTHQKKSTIAANTKLRSALVKTAFTVSLPYNNVGTILDQGTTSATVSANFDGGGYNYSQNALALSGLFSGASWLGSSQYYQEIVNNNTVFDWPDVDYGADDNVVAAGQAITLSATSSATSLGFLGSASGGVASGTAVITYTDGTTQSFTLTLDDWTLGGGKSSVTSTDKIAAGTMYRDNASGVAQNIKTYLFYTGVSLTSGKTVQSVQLPSSTGSAKMHIFSIGFGPSTYTDTSNNTGISDDANMKAGNFDGGGYSYSMQDISQYIYPGDSIYFNGTQMTWDNVLGGSPDNIIAKGQKYTFSNSGNDTKIGFIGSASNGPLCGTGQIAYTDGTSSSYQLCFSDWTLNGGKQSILASDTYYMGFPDRNASTGKTQSVPTFMFFTEVDVPQGKTIASVTLPPAASKGALHIFAMGLGSGAYADNTGTTFDSDPHVFSNFDGGGYSYSQNALQKAGVTAVSLTDSGGYSDDFNYLHYNGVNFFWDESDSVLADNVIAAGQDVSLNDPAPNEDYDAIPVFPVSNATALAFLGSSVSGASSGTGEIVYSDGTTQSFTLGLSDWCATSVSYGNQVATTMSYRNSSTGSQTKTNHLYYAEVALASGKTPTDVILPTQSHMHIFSVGLRAAGSFNNVGTSDDSTPSVANFDNGGYSYSQQALASAGVSSGQSYIYNGVTFTWPAVSLATNDNYVAAGQTVSVTPVSGATTLAFLGSSSNGPSSGTATIKYTDGTTQSFTLTLNDWCAKTSLAGNDAALTMSYRNGPNGSQTITNHIYYTDVTLTAGKTISSVVLPSSVSRGAMHIFAISTK